MKRPRLELHKFYRKRTGSRWTKWKCSECGRELDKSARFCVECGAWFGGRKKK